VFEALRRHFPRWVAGAEISVEGSPDSMTRERLECLKQMGVTRVSMGLQTLDPDEQKRVGRPYSAEAIDRAVAGINDIAFDNVNYDLIYGLEGQRRASWFRSLETTVGFAPKTITLYPVVFRPLTAIHKRFERNAGDFLEDESKYAIYDESVRFLASRGFRQDSFVRFTTLPRGGLRQETADFAGVPLLGLGAGARSYSDAGALQHRLRGAKNGDTRHHQGLHRLRSPARSAARSWLPARRRRTPTAVLRPQSVARPARPSRLRSPLRR
jgi:oxygen-independent coproporphyrinogen-3 oxidase